MGNLSFSTEKEKIKFVPVSVSSCREQMKNSRRIVNRVSSASTRKMYIRGFRK
jgi:hypothetical protein